MIVAAVRVNFPHITDQKASRNRSAFNGRNSSEKNFPQLDNL